MLWDKDWSKYLPSILLTSGFQAGQNSPIFQILQPTCYSDHRGLSPIVYIDGLRKHLAQAWPFTPG